MHYEPVVPFRNRRDESRPSTPLTVAQAGRFPVAPDTGPSLPGQGRGRATGRRVSVVCMRCDLIAHFPAGDLARDVRCDHCGEALFQGRPVDLEEANFDLHVRANHVPVAVVFWAPWCEPCHAALVLAERAARELEPGIRIARVNTDEERSLADRHGVRGIPTIVLFKQGREAARRIGNVDFHAIARWVGK